VSAPEPILLTPEEAARALRIGRTRLYAFLADGTLPSVQIGHSRRIAMRALEEFVRRLQFDDQHVQREAVSTASDKRHDVGQQLSLRSRRRKHPRTTDAELLPLPFPEPTGET
jgi:excisionase family DNA binding protein